ncbi:GYDIA family GHMP kinase [Formosa sp. A9]|uniref:GYDIA family GHMP kinase n=1 Tax=Formosa sp. A9 TaxID=3442641 RepID=UPI003EC06DA1
MNRFYSNGKLLITAEYLVLDGATALALPTTFGQSLQVTSSTTEGITWQSLDEQNRVWFETHFHIHDNQFTSKNDDDLSKRLLSILNAAKSLNPLFLSNEQNISVKTTLDFPRHWGLGTSSTLINNIANWATINPYTLLARTFGGSGYDIACASHNTPICYTLQDKQPVVQAVRFNPKFKEQLYFVYLNEKQNSREGIARYKAYNTNKTEAIKTINHITSALVDCHNLNQFNALIDEHETLISEIIDLQPVKQRLFPDFKGSIKSLGAWGGDFILVTSTSPPQDYFKAKGYTTIRSYNEMIL